MSSMYTPNPVDLTGLLEYNRIAEIFRMSFKFCKLYYGWEAHTVRIEKSIDSVITISPDNRFWKKSSTIVEKSYKDYLLKIPIKENEIFSFKSTDTWVVKDLPLF